MQCGKKSSFVIGMYLSLLLPLVLLLLATCYLLLLAAAGCCLRLCVGGANQGDIDSNALLPYPLPEMRRPGPSCGVQLQSMMSVLHVSVTVTVTCWCCCCRRRLQGA